MNSGVLKITLNLVDISQNILENKAYGCQRVPLHSKNNSAIIIEVNR
jgi:hypothetical protein